MKENEVQKVYVVIDNNHEDYEDYYKWIAGIFRNKEDAEKCVQECHQKYYESLKNYIKEYEEDDDFDDPEWLEFTKRDTEEQYAREIKYCPAKIEEWDLQ